MDVNVQRIVDTDGSASTTSWPQRHLECTAEAGAVCVLDAPGQSWESQSQALWAERKKAVRAVGIGDIQACLQ